MNALPQPVPDVLVAPSAMMLALMVPGLNILAVLGTSTDIGRRHGVALALGVAADAVERRTIESFVADEGI